jgi:hypothetical protein
MSYRNPQQVVDTQSGQAFADLQKTISGTFAGVASAYKKEQDTEAARLKKIAEENKKAAQYYQRKEDQVTESLAKLSAKNPALNIGEEFTGIIDTYSDIMSMIQNGTITDPKEIAKKRAEAASILAIPDQVRTSIESFSASSIDLEKVLKQKGKMGGYDLYSNPELLKDLQVFLDQRPGERKIKINSDNGVYSASIEITSEDGKPNTYSLDVLESFLSGGTDMINSIPDETTHLNNLSNAYVYDVDESTGKKSLRNTVLMGEDTELNEKGEKVTFRKVNKEALKNSIKADVKSNIDAMKTTNAKVAFFNNILADKNVRNEFTGKIATIENVNTDEFQDEFVKKYTDYFLARQPDRLVVRTEKVKTPTTKEGPIQTGKDFYDQVRKNPISYLKEYSGIDAKYDKYNNTITIKAEDRQDADVDLIINMNDPDSRISFYTKLLEQSKIAKGDSKESKLIRKQFSDAVRAGTKKKLNPLMQ